MSVPPSAYTLDLQSRRQYLRIAPQDTRQLASLWTTLAPRLDVILNTFYDHLATVPDLAHFFHGRDLATIKDAQKKHWHLSFTSGFDENYCSSVTRIGNAHARIGLEPRWFLGAYALILSELSTMVAERNKWSATERAAALSAVFKVVFMDMDCIISVYNEMAEQQRLASQQEALLKLIERFDASVSTRIASVAAASEQLSHTTAEISRRIGDNSERVQAVSALASEAMEKNRNLAERAAQISGVTDLIQNIAGQTNLLALNASIEAARAGDAGRGFSVVADEVKKLAARTTEATEDIRQQIEGIIQVSEDVNATSADTARNIDEITNGITSVAGATSQQTAATTDISASITEIQHAIRELFGAVKGPTPATLEDAA